MIDKGAEIDEIFVKQYANKHRMEYTSNSEENISSPQKNTSSGGDPATPRKSRKSRKSKSRKSRKSKSRKSRKSR